MSITKRILSLILACSLALCAFAATNPAKVYDKAQKAMVKGEYDKAAELFGSISSYEDSSQQAMYCKAVSYGEKGQYEEALKALDLLDNFKDSVYLKTYYSICEKAFYKDAKISDVLIAAEEFDKISIFRDSAEKAEECRQIVYDTALYHYEEGNYVLASSIFSYLGNYKDSAAQIEVCQEAIKEEQYQKAVALHKSGDYADAYEIFASLKSYKDVDIIIKTDKNIAAAREAYLAQFEVGTMVSFGAYEQDNDASNGKEIIEWLILARDGDKALVISKKALDCQQYNNISDTAVTWMDCTLRAWLNETFLKDAFNSTEQKQIFTSNITAERNPKYNTYPGLDTSDKIFLLSIQELNNYFSTNEERMCKASEYAQKHGCDDDYYGYCKWWLRSPGKYSNAVAYVRTHGTVEDDGFPIYGAAVRPALWINLDPTIIRTAAIS